MAIIPQVSMFVWSEIEELGDLERLRMVIENMPDEKLMRTLEKERGITGRDADVYKRQVSGHQRLKILEHQGQREIETVVVDLDEQQEKALNITLNKVSGEWDLPKLADLISELDDGIFDISITGFDAAEIEHLFSQVHDKDVKEDDFDVDEALKEPVISRPGDLWLLGKHRLFCGDSTKGETYEILMDGKKANLVVTDPPYNVNFTAGTEKERLIKNDHQPDSDFYQFLLDAFKHIYQHLADGGALYVFHADTEGLNFRNAVKEVGFHLSGVCRCV